MKAISYLILIILTIISCKTSEVFKCDYEDEKARYQAAQTEYFRDAGPANCEAVKNAALDFQRVLEGCDDYNRYANQLNEYIESSCTQTPVIKTGQASFWMAADPGCGAITVNIDNKTANITGFHFNGVADCNATGKATFTLSPGTYTYTAACTGESWSGEVTVTADGCTPVKLEPKPPVSGVVLLNFAYKEKYTILSGTDYQKDGVYQLGEMTIDKYGNKYVLVTGTSPRTKDNDFSGTPLFGPLNLLKFDTNGNTIWCEYVPSTYHERAEHFDIKTDINGNVYLLIRWLTNTSDWTHRFDLFKFKSGSNAPGDISKIFERRDLASTEVQMDIDNYGNIYFPIVESTPLGRNTNGTLDYIRNHKIIKINSEGQIEKELLLLSSKNYITDVRINIDKDGNIYYGFVGGGSGISMITNHELIPWDNKNKNNVVVKFSNSLETILWIKDSAFIPDYSGKDGYLYDIYDSQTIRQYNWHGEQLWERVFQPEGDIKSIEADESGNVYIGWASNGRRMENGQKYEYVLVSKYSSTGAKIQDFKIIGDEGRVEATDIAIYDKEVFVTGSIWCGRFWGEESNFQFNFSNATLRIPNPTQMFLARIQD